jgi:DNA-binding response OmpR family regulator
MENIKVLIVEDNVSLNDFLFEFLQIYFKNIRQSYDGIEALEMYKEYHPDLIITDINLPRLDGLSLIEEIRKKDQETQIIVASSYSDQEKLLKAVELKLVTYLIKPINNEKLKEIILSIKKAFQNSNLVYITPTYFFNLSTSQLFYNDTEVDLTLNEKKVLLLLIENKNRCVTYEEISTYIYDYEEFSLNAITSLIKRLRKKLSEKIIITCYNQGYKVHIDL